MNPIYVVLYSYARLTASGTVVKTYTNEKEARDAMEQLHAKKVDNVVLLEGKVLA